jgi:cyclopropane fatty-acyl-phospholipid synthase-like methyltransferase
MHWTLDKHKNMYPNNFNDGMNRWVVENLKPKTVLEFGCGIGWYCEFFANHGVQTVHGIEPAPMDPEKFSHENATQFTWDATVDPEPEGILPEYDMIFSVEVMEHVARQYHTKIIDWMHSKNPRVVVFSAATPGQGGHGHIAERPQAEWIGEWTSRGYAIDTELTKQIKASCNRRNINHVKNLHVYKPI